MARILTVDDSRAVRTLIRKALAELPFEIVEAEDGEKGLVAVEDTPPDIILLDVTMPVLDGPGMLQRLRALGNTTPVILLTAESGTSVIGPMLKQGGICEYIVKPFKPEQLRAKVIDALQRNGALPNLGVPVAEKSASGKEPAFMPTGKTFVDILLVDDMDNVAKKLRTMLPERLTFNSCCDAGSAVAMCRERSFRVVIVDTEMPSVTTADLLRDLRILQPTAAFVALVMRSHAEPGSFARELGFVGHLVKPFDASQIEELIGAYFESNDLLHTDGNVIKPGACKAAGAAADVFFKRLQQAMLDALDQAAAACHDRAILDLGNLEVSSKLQKMVVRLAEKGSELGIELRIVGNAETAKMLKQLVETAAIPVVDNVDAAKAA